MTVIEWVAQPVEVAVSHKLAILAIVSDLAGDLSLVLLRDPGHVQLIAEGACKSSVSPCGKGRNSANCVIWAVGNMGADS